ncbi:MAG TPA: hypothetical protein VJ847_05915 [Gemmatimonadales bacterium]|nr:hypothetical protein [Gemmatimonadales bacterium]
MRLSLLTFAALALLGCGDSFSPTRDSVAGSYTLTRLVTTSTGRATDQLGDGATMTITLAPGGTTTGRLVLPAGDVNGAGLDASMEGTWSLTGDRVVFTQGADTFIRDLTFTVTADELTADDTFGGTRVEITLTRAAP